jgi:hypothetical protein
MGLELSHHGILAALSLHPIHCLGNERSLKLGVPGPCVSAYGSFLK